LHFFQGLTHDTNAAIIDVHPDTVKRMVLPAKVNLARELDGFGLSDD
jgi:DNA-directed RNA polymerase specialized sigma24 family protein